MSVAFGVLFFFILFLARFSLAAFPSYNAAVYIKIGLHPIEMSCIILLFATLLYFHLDFIHLFVSGNSPLLESWLAHMCKRYVPFSILFSCCPLPTRPPQVMTKAGAR